MQTFSGKGWLLSLEPARLQFDSTPAEHAGVNPDGGEDTPVVTSLTAEPLCVDLDGTLVKSDTLLDTVIVLARQSPRSLLQFPRWLAQGKAAFKRQVTRLAQIDVVHLPYNQPLLEYLRQIGR